MARTNFTVQEMKATRRYVRIRAKNAEREELIKIMNDTFKVFNNKPYYGRFEIFRIKDKMMKTIKARKLEQEQKG